MINEKTFTGAWDRDQRDRDRLMTNGAADDAITAFEIGATAFESLTPADGPTDRLITSMVFDGAEDMVRAMYTRARLDWPSEG